MSTFQEILVKDLEPPDEPDRQHSIMQGMDELVADIKAHGLLNPICVETLGDGRYRVFAGHRRSIAVTIMQWKSVMCHVFAQGDPAIERMKASENLKRNQLSEAEEALVYRRVQEREGKTPADIAMYYDRPVSRVTELIDVSCGDPATFEALARGDISRAQAVEINHFETPAYKMLALEQAVKHGLKAPGLRRWRLDVKNQGGEQNTQSILDNLKTMAPLPVEEPMQVCFFTNHPAPLRLSKHYVICSEHYDMIVKGLELLAVREAEKNGGGRTATQPI